MLGILNLLLLALNFRSYFTKLICILGCASLCSGMYLGSCLAPFKIMGHAPEVTYLIWPKNWATLCMDVFSIMCLVL